MTSFLSEERNRQQEIFLQVKRERRSLLLVTGLTSYNVFSRDAEVDRDKFVDEAKKLLVRATEYKEEAKREHEKMKEKWRRETLEESEKTGPLEEVLGSNHLL